MCASGDATQHTIRRYTIRKIIKTEFLSPRVFIDFSYCVSRTGTISAIIFQQRKFILQNRNFL